MDRPSRISQHDGGWWFWQESYMVVAGRRIPGSWIGPYDDRDEAEGCMSSSDADDAQAKWEIEHPDEEPS